MSFEAGQKLPAKTLSPITQDQLRAYAQASGDPNPIHLDETVAKKMGLPGVIAHGMLIAGFLAERALEAAEGVWGDAARLKKFQIRFKAMTLLGDVLAIQSSVKSASGRDANLELQALNQRGEPVATATASITSAL